MKDAHPVTPPALLRDADEIITRYRHDPSKLLEILLEVQQSHPLHYIPRSCAYYIAEQMNLKPTQIYDVISFFSALHDKPRAKHPIQVCSSVVCQINQSGFVLDTLRELLGIGVNETTYDYRFTSEEVPCFGACDRAPAIRVHEVVYGPLKSREQIAEIIERLELE